MASFADIIIRLGVDLKQFSSQIQNAQRDLNRMGKNLQNIGAGLTLGLTAPLTGLGALALNAAADFETLNTSLLTVFQGNEAAAKQAFDQITEFTAQTPFQLEEVAEGFIKLKNLGLDPGIDSLRSYGNTASALGKTLDQFIEAVADASVNEFERLKEFGIKAKQEGDKVAFTFQGVTTTIGKNSEEITEYLQNIGNTTFAGGIERQAQTFNGVMSTLRDNLKLLAAEFGEIIIDGVKPLLGFLQDIIARFRDLSPETKKWIVILGGVAAAVGPLLALAGTILPAIGTGLTLLTGPIGLVVAALAGIGTVIYQYWEPIKATLVDIANYFIDLYNESTVFRIAVEAIVTSFKNVLATGKFVFSTIGNVVSALATSIKNAFQPLGDLIKAILTGDIQQIPTILAANFRQGLQVGKDLLGDIKEDFAVLKNTVAENIETGVNNALNGKRYELLSIDASGVEKSVSDAVASGLQNGLSGNTGGGIGTSQTDKLNIESQGLSAITVTEFTNPLGTMAEQLQESTEGIKIALSDTGEALTNFQEISQIVGLEVADAFESMTGRFIDSLGLADTGFEGFAKNLAQTISKIIAMLLANSIANAITGSTQSGLATGAGAVFTTPAFIATAVSGVLAAFAAIPKFATGGFVPGTSFTGDTTLIRANAGELILNLAQQRNLASALGGGVNVTLQPSLRYEGDGFKIMLDKVEQKRNRIT